MTIAGAYQLAKRLPRPIRAVAKFISSRYFEHRGYSLTGPLAGCRMIGQVHGNHLDGSYEPDIVRIMTQIVTPGSVCVDVGAHHGYFTLLMAKYTGARGLVVAFEAYPPNAEQLRANVRVNGYQSRVRVENLAISDGTSSQVTLYYGRGGSSSELNIVGHDVEGNSTTSELEVAAVSLDAYFLSNSSVSVIKMDIEGAEAEALRGARRLLREGRPIVVVEFHGEHGWRGKEELLDAHYTLFNIQGEEPLPIIGQESKRVYHCLAMPEERSHEVLRN